MASGRGCTLGTPQSLIVSQKEVLPMMGAALQSLTVSCQGATLCMGDAPQVTISAMGGHHLVPQYLCSENLWQLQEWQENLFLAKEYIIIYYYAFLAFKLFFHNPFYSFQKLLFVVLTAQTTRSERSQKCKLCPTWEESLIYIPFFIIPKNICVILWTFIHL